MGHHVANLAQSAIKSGLDIGSEQSEILTHIADADVAIEARYIVTGFKTLPTNEALSSVAGHLDQTVCGALAKAGLPVRGEKLVRPEQLQQQNVLSDDTVCVLVHMFRTTNYQGREVGAMATVLQLERNVLKYHLDRLEQADFAEMAGGNYLHGHIYWDLTPEGRRYVVEHKLV